VKGIAASSGIAIGIAYLKKDAALATGRKIIGEDEIEKEKERLQEALSRAREELQRIKEETRCRLGETKAGIFQAHLLLLEDPELIPAMEKYIGEERVGVEEAVIRVIDHYRKIFEAMEDEYMRARGIDLEDVGRRIVRILSGSKEGKLTLKEESIVVARDLTPSDTAGMEHDKILAFVTQEGSRTSHTSIIARSLGIPAVVGVRELMEKVKEGDLLVVDGDAGVVLVNPDKDAQSLYVEKLHAVRQEKERVVPFRWREAAMACGHRVKVAGNIGTPTDVRSVLEQGGEGIGLFRTEFLYMNREELPSEVEQLEAYIQVAREMNEKPVIIRTLDVGGDKELPYLNLPIEKNPFLGYRAIRLCLDQPAIFKSQLRAIFRAGIYKNIKLMLPFISSLEELRQSRKIIAQVKAELTSEGKEFDPGMEVGIMIEIPAAAILAPAFAREVDFFSIGTNDLIQYALAVDRTNEKIESLHTPFHPVVLRLISQTIEAGHREGIKVGMCGEAAGEELLLPFLLGVGLDELSMSASFIPRIKERMSYWTLEEARNVVQKLLELSYEEEIKEQLYKVKK
jgi:phosphotransferase system enzyme I (PtsI)